MNRKLYVGNIAYETTESDLEQLFSQSGTVESVRVMQTAINQLHEKQFGGRTLTVNEARPQAPRSGGFGGGGRDHSRGGGGGGGGSRRREPRW